MKLEQIEIGGHIFEVTEENYGDAQSSFLVAKCENPRVEVTAATYDGLKKRVAEILAAK